jgi:hypothetical protein
MPLSITATVTPLPMVSGQALVKFSTFCAQGVVLILELVGLYGCCGALWQFGCDADVTGTGAGGSGIPAGRVNGAVGVGEGPGVGLEDAPAVGLAVAAGAAAPSGCAPGATAANAVAGSPAATARPSAGAAIATSAATAIRLIPLPSFDRTDQSNSGNHIGYEMAATFAASVAALAQMTQLVVLSAAAGDRPAARGRCPDGPPDGYAPGGSA